MPGCSDVVALAVQTDMTLTPDQVALVQSHLSDCAACRDKVTEFAVGTGSPLQREDRGPDLVGTTIRDRYEVTDELGHGGMGTVYRARDRSLGREVALKVHHAGSHDDRLEREAQAMARLAHPNVVTVFEIGNVGDRMFVAMEYVRGTTLRAWLAKPHEGRAIIDALIAAGEGLAAAHAAGLVHRDFKPENVLVGDDGRVRVSDFGLAGASVDLSGVLATPADISDVKRSPLTVTGGVLGTPAYMAPEQLTGDGVDARCDQFAFCVTAWEALYGRRPFTSGSPFSAPQMVAKKDLPTHGTALPRVRAVLERGLSVDPQARFANMTELLAALRAAVSTKRIKRIALAAGFLGVAATAAVVSAGTMTDGPTCATGDEKIAEVWGDPQRSALTRAFETSKAGELAPAVVRNLDEYARAWSASYLDACQATQVHGDQSADLLDRRMACLDRSRFALVATVDVLSKADRKIAEKAVSVASSLPDLDACADREALLGTTAPPASLLTRSQVAAARARLATSDALRNAGQYKASLVAALGVLETARAVDHKPLVAEALFSTAAAELGLDQGANAEKHLYEALRFAEVGGDHELTARIWFALINAVGMRLDRPVEAEKLLALAEAATDRARRPARLEIVLARAVGNLRIELGSYAEARVAFARGVELALEENGPDDPTAAGLMMAEANTLENQGKIKEALALYEKARPIMERAYGPEHPEMVRVYENIGIAAGRLDDFDRAIKELTAAKVLAEKTLGDHSQHAEVIDELGLVYLQQTRSDLAIPYFERAIAMYTRVVGLQHSGTIEAMGHLGLAQKRLGQLDAAWDTQTRAVELMEKARGPDHPRLAAKLQNLGVLAMERGDHAKSLELHQRVRAIVEKGKNPMDSLLGLARQASADALNLLGRYPEAIAEATAAYPIAEANEDPGNMAASFVTRAQAEIELRRHADAVAHALHAVDILTKAGGEPMDLAEPRFVLAQALWAAGQRKRALEVGRDVRAVYAASPEGTAGVAALDEWLRGKR